MEGGDACKGSEDEKLTGIVGPLNPEPCRLLCISTAPNDGETARHNGHA